METETLVGTFSYDSSENMDEYLKALGVGLVLRKVLSVAHPTYHISHNADINQWTIVSESEFKKKEWTFRPAEKFEDETFDGRSCQTTVEVGEDKRSMTWQQTCEEGPHVTVSVAVTEDGFKQNLQAGEELACELKFRRGLHQRISEPRQAVADEPANDDEVDDW